MKVLITGRLRTLGKSLKETAPGEVRVKSTWYTNCIGCDYQMDVSNQSQVSYIFSHVKPDVVIHCAANGSVDYAERNYTEVHKVNVDGVKNVARIAHDHQAKFVFISTNAVFSGNNPPYSETSNRNPVNAYGRIKREAEERVKDLRHWLIIRPFLLYGWPYKNGRSNWFYTILRSILDNKPLRLVDDVYWQPTSAKECASAIWQLIPDYDNEIFNVATDERVTLYEFGQTIAKLWGYEGKDYITPIGSSELTGLAPRPVDTTYDLSKLHEAGVTLDGIERGLKALQ